MKNEDFNENLIVQYATDPQKGFERIYLAYADKLMQYAIHSFRLNIEEAEDALHEAMLPWVKNPQKMLAIKNIRAYLYASVRNACIKKHGNFVSTISLIEEATTFENQNTLLQLDIAAGLEKLPEEQRETIYLKIWGDLTFAEIAELHGICIQTVASRYRYALARLKEILQWNP